MWYGDEGMTNRVALVIGIASYPFNPLPNPVDDAGRAADVLARRGFSVTSLLDATASAIDDAVTAFRLSARGADISLVYLAGHAVERHGVGYFLPIDFPFPPTPTGARHFGVNLDDLVKATSGALARIVILDACRNWPTQPMDQLRIGDDMDGLAADVREWGNVLLAFSTSSSTVAGDGKEGQGSDFCNAFCRHFLDHALNVDECFRRISQDVVRCSLQQPWTYSSLDKGLTFSDLPRFSVLQRHFLPNPARSVAAWCTPDRESAGIYAGLGESKAWHVDLAGLGQVIYGGSAGLVGAAALVDHMILAGQAGELFRADRSATPVVELGTDPSFGIVVSPGRHGFIHYGDRTATVFEAKDAAIQVVGRVTTDFDIYCCAYISEKLAWLAGERGRIAELDLSSKEPTIRAVTDLAHHINALAVSPDGSTVFCACQAGLLAAVERTTVNNTRLLDRRRPQTAAGIRAALMHIAEDDIIRDYIFQPARLRVGAFDQLSEHLHASDFPSCAHAPTRPFLAVGTDESTLLLLDTRDGQIFQEIDLSAGFPGAVSGLVFLSETELVTIGSEGHVTFLASA